jgi:DNA-binding NtrC family response regulator
LNIQNFGGAKMSNRVLVVDDDGKTRDILCAFLNYKGYQVYQASDSLEALHVVDQHDIDLVITDFMMPKMNGIELINRLKALLPDIVVIVCSAYRTSDMTASLLKAGAFICLDKPFDLEDIDTHVRRGLEHRSFQLRNFKCKPDIKNRVLLKNIVGESQIMLSLLELVEKVAASDSTVLLLGESGTGKELIAQAIHTLSNRRNKNFVPINCGAIPNDLLESELFGHVKGSFTGAVANRIGRFAMADKGTIFLDEIGDMKLSLQVKLLRVLQNREVEPVGAAETIKIDTRFVAATNQNLDTLVLNKSFREDLYYRLSVIPITIPPLRERKEDIPMLVDNFIKKISTSKMRKVVGIEQGAMNMLCNYHWPGNIRELENLIERLIIIKGTGTISIKDLPEKYFGIIPQKSSQVLHLSSSGICFNTALEEFENSLIIEALEKTGGNKKEAALLLNLKRTTLIEKLKKKNLFLGRSIPSA